MASPQGFTQAQLEELYSVVLAVVFKNDGDSQVKTDIKSHIDNYGLSVVWNVITKLGRTDTTFAAIDLKTHVLPYISTSYATDNDVYNILLTLKTPKLPKS